MRFPAKTPRNTLARIFECDLDELADLDHAVTSVENLSSDRGNYADWMDGFCYWRSPYPSYVDRTALTRWRSLSTVFLGS